jgi:hypothetical protein
MVKNILATATSTLASLRKDSFMAMVFYFALRK